LPSQAQCPQTSGESGEKKRTEPQGKIPGTESAIAGRRVGKGGKKYARTARKGGPATLTDLRMAKDQLNRTGNRCSPHTKDKKEKRFTQTPAEKRHQDQKAPDRGKQGPQREVSIRELKPPCNRGRVPCKCRAI